MKILNVDDNAENRYLIETLGQANGFEVVSARNGLEALEVLDRQPVDLIVSDVLMPEMDGFQLCHEVKSRERTLHIPFIFYTATYTAEQDAELGLSLGASRYILKPADPDEFMTIVREVISKAQKRELAVPESELKGTVDYLKAYTARLVQKLDRKIEQLDAARNELQALLAVRDSEIAERKRAEAALAASESRLHALLESASQGVVAVCQDGRIALVNAKTEAMFGYARDELLGQPLEVLLPERYRPAHAEHLRHYFADPYTRVMVLGFDLRGRTKNGNEFPVEVTLSCAEFNGSRLAMALITDITERKKAEDRLWQAQKLESIGLLAGGVAHDFNNLLVGVIGNASLAREMLPPGEAVELLKRVVKSGEQLAHLTRQMLAYAGKGRFAVEQLRLSDLIPEISELARSSFPREIALNFELEPVLPLIEADRGQIQQVFMNLLLNAAEAIGSNAGVISVKTGLQVVDEAYIRHHPEVTQLHPGEYVYLEMRDNGCGMDESTKAKIFDPFFSTKFTGRGLGLAAVSGIVRGHKGAIMVRSSRGKGSCFTVLFPVTEHAIAVSPARTHDTNLLGSGTVLVVDDEEVVLGVVKGTLERYGYHVLLADSGLAAIDVFKRHPDNIATVILDLGMPGMDGRTALHALQKIRPSVKVVIASGYSEAEVMKLFAGQHVSGFLQKPFTPTRLAETIKKVISGS